MLTWNEQGTTFLGCDSHYDDSHAVLFGAPFDATTSYRPGTRFASRVMRAESYALETYSPYQDRDLADCKVFDGGDLNLPFGNVAAALDAIEGRTAAILADDKIPVMLGGEHLVTLGAVRAAAKKHPGLHILHLDAHTDLRDDYLGESLSHATVMRRCWDLLGDRRIYQFGIRSGDKSEFDWAKQGHVYMQKINLYGFEQTVEMLQGKPIYLSIDLDVLDPSVFPGTGTPEAGGISFMELHNAILSLQGANVVACDLNELSPPYDPSGISTATALKVLRELLLAIV